MACINFSVRAGVDAQSSFDHTEDGEKHYLSTLSPRIFPSYEAMAAALQETAKQGGYGLSIGASHKDSTGVKKTAEFVCDRYGEYRNHRQLADEDRQRKRSTKKCGCRFKIKSSRTENTWSFVYCVDFHNHPASTDEVRKRSRSRKGVADSDESTTSATPNPLYFPQRPPIPTSEELARGVSAALDIQRRALIHKKRPFAAALIGPDNVSVLLTHQSVDHVNHAEASLARMAATHFEQPYLWTCTLYSTWEPCAMCVSTCYWAHIGRIVYAASEDRLREITGDGNEENFTMSMPCRDVLRGSQKPIEIIGPIPQWEDIVVRESDEGYWRGVREARHKIANGT